MWKGQGINIAVLASLAILFLLSVLPLTGLFQVVKAAGGTITINANGSISPSTAPIYSADNITYTLTGNMSYPTYNGIVIERSNTVINGDGYAVQGSNSGNGVSLNGISNVSIENVNVEGFSSGIYLYKCSSNVVSGNNATASSVGIILDSCSNNIVSGNNAKANSYYGIYLHISSNNTISGNNVTTNNGGIFLDSSSNDTVSGNNATANGRGIWLSSSSGNVLNGNVIEDNGQDFGVFGSVLSDFMNSVDTSNLVDGKPIYCVTNESNCVICPEDYPSIGYLAIINCTNMTVQGLTLTNNVQGILLAFTNDSKITNSNITNNWDGIDLESSSNNTLNSNNETTNSYDGIDLESSSNNTVNSNNATGNSYDGIHLYRSPNNTLDGNNATGNSNDGIYLLYSSNNTVSENDASVNGYGIYVDGSSNNTVSGNNVTGNKSDGIFLSSSSHTIINCNNATANNIGIEIIYSSNNTVSENDASVNGYGVYMDGSSNNTVSWNNSTANSWGIYLDRSSDNNTVNGNNASANINGIVVQSSSNNTIFHNTFVGNSVQVSVGTASISNTWDEGYPVGGNYWSDYNGTDLKSGQYANVTGSDGIGDVPYVIDANNTDYFPLMGTFSSFSTLQGYPVNIISNSTISGFVAPIWLEHPETTTLTFNVTGTNNSIGFCRVSFPTAMMNGTYHVSVNGTEVPYILLPSSNANVSYLYFTYKHSTEQVIILPEFPSFLILSLFMIATLLSVIIYKRKHAKISGTP